MNPRPLRSMILIILCAIALLSACEKEPDASLPPPPLGSATTPTIVLTVNKVYDYEIPRVVPFPAIVIGGNADLQKEADYLCDDFVITISFAPEPLLDPLSSTRRDNLMAKGSSVYRPTEQLSPDELAKYARAFDALHYLVLRYGREGDNLTFDINAYATADQKKVFSKSVTGDWETVSRQLGELAPELVRALGANPSERQDTAISRPSFGHIPTLKKMIAFDSGEPTEAEWHTLEGRQLLIEYYEKSTEPTLAMEAGALVARTALQDDMAAWQEVLSQVQKDDSFDALLAYSAIGEFYHADNLAQSRAIVLALAEAFPRYYMPNNWLSVVLVHSLDPESALRVAERARKISPENWLTYSALSAAHMHLGYRESQKSNPQTRTVKNHFKIAQEYAEAAQRLAPMDPYANVSLAKVIPYNGGSLQSSLEITERAVELGPTEAQPLSDILTLSLRDYCNQRAKGLDLWNKYKDRITEKQTPFLVISVLRLFVDSYYVDEKQLQWLVSNDQPHAAEWFELYVRAIPHLDDMPQSVQDEVNGYFPSAAYCGMYSGKVTANLDALDKYLRKRGSAVEQEALFYSAWQFLEGGRPDRALELLNQSLGKNSIIDSQIPFFRALATARMGNVDAALEEWNRIKDRPVQNHPYLRDTIHIQILTEGTREQKEQALALAREKLATNDKPHFILYTADILIKLGRPNEARELLLTEYQPFDQYAINPMIQRRWDLVKPQEETHPVEDDTPLDLPAQ